MKSLRSATRQEGSSRTARFPLPNADTPPVPVNADYNRTSGVMTVTFNKPLVNQPTALVNWLLTLQTAATEMPTGSLVVPPTEVQLQFSMGLELLESIEYFATPPDVVGTNG